MGHGGGDKYGYSREVLDEDYCAKELAKLWRPNVVSGEDLASRDSRIKKLEEELAETERLTRSFAYVVERLVKKGALTRDEQAALMTERIASEIDEEIKHTNRGPKKHR